MFSRAMVTGGAGFIGSTLVDRLIDDGVEVLVVDDLSRGKLARLGAARRSGAMVFHQLDVRAPELGKAAARFRPEVVFHLAAQIDAVASVIDPVGDAETNVVGTVNVLTAAVAAAAERVVYVSSGGAIYGAATSLPASEKTSRHPATPYGVSKSVADNYLRLFAEIHDLDYVSLGPSNVYGPRQDSTGEGGVVGLFTSRLLAGERPIIYGDGSQTRDFVYVEDVADACMRAAVRGGGRYLNISTGTETSVTQLVDLISVATGRRIAPDYAPARDGDVSRSCLDPSAAKRRLGWEPWTTLERGLEQTVEWFRAR
jgi:UDP-glucose 4-epimerase